ncbi:MAG: DUF2812 domain-containing protein [Maricaulaceae bacterium]
MLQKYPTPEPGVIKYVFRLYTVWQEAQETAWLESMAAEGWHVSGYWLCIYRFVGGEPRRYRYEFDYRPGFLNAHADYFALCAEAGWERRYSFMGWHCLRADPDIATSAPIYSDRADLANKYRRLLRTLGLAASLSLIAFGVTLILARETITTHAPGLVFVSPVLSVTLLVAILRTRWMINRMGGGGC